MARRLLRGGLSLESDAESIPDGDAEARCSPRPQSFCPGGMLESSESSDALSCCADLNANFAARPDFTAVASTEVDEPSIGRQSPGGMFQMEGSAA